MQELTIPSSEVQVDEIVVLKPGDKVPVDGEVTEGETSIDEALVTGESAPVTKRPGDAVIAGSINRSGSVRFRATKVGADTTLAQIVELVQQAQNSKAPGQRLADRAAQYLVILAVGSGVVTFMAWYFFGGATAITALTFAISAVVIACPDALGLATPTAVAVGTGVGREAQHPDQGRRDAGERLGHHRDRARQDRHADRGQAGADRCGRDGWQLTEHGCCCGWSPRPSSGSEHPLAEAIVAGARARGANLADATEFEAIAGHGIRATVDGRMVLVGNAS